MFSNPAAVKAKAAPKLSSTFPPSPASDLLELVDFELEIDSGAAPPLEPAAVAMDVNVPVCVQEQLGLKKAEVLIRVEVVPPDWVEEGT